MCRIAASIQEKPSFAITYWCHGSLYFVVIFNSHELDEKQGALAFCLCHGPRLEWDPHVASIYLFSLFLQVFFQNRNLFYNHIMVADPMVGSRSSY